MGLKVLCDSIEHIIVGICVSKEIENDDEAVIGISFGGDAFLYQIRKDVEVQLQLPNLL